MPLHEVSFCERAAGTGLQIFFERDGALSIREFERDDKPPRTKRCGVLRGSGVVGREPSCHVVRQSDVVAALINGALKNVDEADGHRHAMARLQQPRPAGC